MHGLAALEDQGPALCLTDLWQAQGGSQRGRSTRVGKLTEKRFRFGRRAPGLTFVTTMTTSSVPVALRAASQKVLAAVRKFRLIAAYPWISSGRCSREPAPWRDHRGRDALWSRRGCGVAPHPAAENEGEWSSARPFSAMRRFVPEKGTPRAVYVRVNHRTPTHPRLPRVRFVSVSQNARREDVVEYGCVA